MKDVGPVIPEWVETAGISFANAGSLRRNALRLVHERLERGLDGPLPHHGRKLVQGEVKSAFGFGAGRWRLAASTP